MPIIVVIIKTVFYILHKYAGGSGNQASIQSLAKYLLSSPQTDHLNEANEFTVGRNSWMTVLKIQTEIVNGCLCACVPMHVCVYVCLCVCTQATRPVCSSQ